MHISANVHICKYGCFVVFSHGGGPCDSRMSLSGRLLFFGLDGGNFGSLFGGGAAQQLDRAVGRILKWLQHNVSASAEQFLGVAWMV